MSSIKFSTISSSERSKISLRISAPTMMFTGVFGLDAFSEYRTRKRSSSIAGNISSENTFAHDFSRHFLSRSVRRRLRSNIESCWLGFALYDMKTHHPCFLLFYHIFRAFSPETCSNDLLTLTSYCDTNQLSL